jgi:voltage-gated potassium channel
MKSEEIIIPVVILVLMIFAGGFIYSNIEGWRFFDSVYYTVVTITTIGYGDFVPQTDLGKFFTMMFVFLGIAMAFYLFSIIGRYIFEKQIKKELAKSEKLAKERKKIKI